MKFRLNPRVQFLAIWTGEFASLLGSSLSSFGIATWVYMQTHQAGAMAGLLFWKFFTQIYLSLFAGHIVDYLPKRFTLITANAGLLAISGALAWSFTSVGPPMPLLYAAMAFLGAFDSLKTLSFQALTPILIENNSLPRFNGLVTVFESLPPVLGPPLAAVGLRFFGIQSIIAADALTFAIALIPAILVRPDETSLMGGRLKPCFSDMLIGLSHILRDRDLRTIQLFFTFQNFFNGIAAGLVAAFVLSRSGGEPSVLALVTSVIAFASVVGGLWQTAFPVKERIVLTIVVLTAVGALAGRVAVGFGVGALVWGLGLGLRSFFNPIVSACNQTYWQRRTAREIQGRVFGARRVLGQGLYPLAIGVGAMLTSAFPDISAEGPGSGLARIFIWVGAAEFTYAVVWLWLRAGMQKLAGNDF